MRHKINTYNRIYRVAFLGLLAAISVVIASFSVPIGEFIKISFSFLTLALAGMTYGPFTSAIFGGVTDILNYLVKPTGPFFPGFTISAIVIGLIYGIGLKVRKITLKRIIIVQLICAVVVNLCLNTIWLIILYKVAWAGVPTLLATRVIKTGIMLPIEVMMMYIVLTQYEKIIKPE